MQKRKNTVLLIIFFVLLAWTVYYALMRDHRTGISLDENKFSVSDTSDINSITITGESVSNNLSKGNTHWMVNGRFPMDHSMQKVLLSVLHQVRVKKTVPRNDLERIRKDIINNGFRIEVNYESGDSDVFYAGGNGISLSYFMDEDSVPYIVHLPGYESYVTGIFEVKEDDWRDRMIYQTSWLGIKSLNLTYPGNPMHDVIIRAADDLYQVEGVANLDTTALMTYLDEISYFYTDQYIESGQIPSYDSLLRTKPFARFSVNSLGMKEPVTIDFYREIPGENVILGFLNNTQLCLFNKSRISGILKHREHFSSK